MTQPNNAFFHVMGVALAHDKTGKVREYVVQECRKRGVDPDAIVPLPCPICKTDQKPPTKPEGLDPTTQALLDTFGGQVVDV